jgi:hypothetical protein
MMRLMAQYFGPPMRAPYPKVDEIEKVEEHLSLDASVCLKAKNFNLFKDFKIYLRMLVK